MRKFHLANIIKPALNLPLGIDIIIETEMTDSIKILVQKGVLIEE